ncbi:MAG: hypothetical protein GY719_26115 [bacterium]|nr:hypothetical protein [bacterium]
MNRSPDFRARILCSLGQASAGLSEALRVADMDVRRALAADADPAQYASAIGAWTSALTGALSDAMGSASCALSAESDRQEWAELNRKDDLLRALADWPATNRRRVELIGLEAPTGAINDSQRAELADLQRIADLRTDLLDPFAETPSDQLFAAYHAAHPDDDPFERDAAARAEILAETRQVAEARSLADAVMAVNAHWGAAYLSASVSVALAVREALGIRDTRAEIELARDVAGEVADG